MKRLLILLLTGLFAQLVVSCYPEGADNIEDYDVAITNYDKGADFSAFTTFSIPDTVVYFANDNSAGTPDTTPPVPPATLVFIVCEPGPSGSFPLLPRL